jgi:hypothetical protein
MAEKCLVGPDLVDVLELVPLNDHLHTDLYPGGDTNEKSNVPIGGLFNNGFQLGVPVPRFCNLFTGLVKRGKPN